MFFLPASLTFSNFINLCENKTFLTLEIPSNIISNSGLLQHHAPLCALHMCRKVMKFAFPFSQFNVDPNRHADQGSSCCAFFISDLIGGFLKDAVMVENLFSTNPDEAWWREKILSAVRIWDSLCVAASSLTHGTDVVTTVRSHLPELDPAVGKWRVVEELCLNKGALVDFITTQAPESDKKVFCLTAPKVKSPDREGQVGNTIGIFIADTQTIVVDSHGHGGEGMIIGKYPSFTEAVATWIYDELLPSAGCDPRQLDVVAVIMEEVVEEESLISHLGIIP